MKTLVPLLLVLLLPLAARAEEERSPESLLADALAATDPADRLRLSALAAGMDPDGGRLAAALPAAWRRDPSVKPGTALEWTRASDDGVERTIAAYVPEGYTPERAWPVLVWLHGGVSQAPEGAGRSAVPVFRDEADAKGFLVLAPSGGEGAVWWSPSGARLVRGSVGDLARRCRVDADRVAVAGFSDGGSAAFHLLVHDPEPYACFLAFMGNPVVTRLAGGPTWAPNAASRPVFAVNGAKDPLYPSERMRPLMEELTASGADLTWTSDEEAGHAFEDVVPHWEAAYAFWQAHPRDPLPKAVRWATSLPGDEGRLAWVEIRGTAPDAPAAEGLPEPAELVVSVPPRPRLGIRIAREHEGEGLLIEGVEAETPAAEAGFQPGDLLVAVGETELSGPEGVAALMTYLQGLTEAGRFVVKRGDERVVLAARPRLLPQDVPERPAALGYDEPAGLVEARVAGENRIEVTSRGVSDLRLHLAAPLVDFGKDLVVTWNGRTVFQGPPPRSAAWLISEAVRAGPGAPAWRGSLDLSAPAR